VVTQFKNGDTDDGSEALNFTNLLRKTKEFSSLRFRQETKL
jgi:hypothetical protein